jgi:stage V sporulation protein B
MIHEETLAKKFVQKWFWIYLFTFLIAPLGYITRMAISRDLNVSEVWMLYWVFSFIWLLSAFNDFGCTESLNYFLPKYIIKNEFGKAKYLLKFTFTIQLITSISIGWVIFYSAPWLAENYFNSPEITDILKVATLFFIWVNLTHITTILLSISQNMKILKGIDFLRALFMVTGVFILYFADIGDLLHYSWIWIISIFMTLIFSSIYAYLYYYKPHFQHVPSIGIEGERRKFIKYALATLLTANIWTLLSQVDMQMIIYLLGTEKTGYYSNYLSIISIPFMIITPLVWFLFPVISELHWRKNFEKIQLLQSYFSLYIWIIWIWMWVFLVQFWEPLSILFFGENFIQSGTLLKYSAGFILFNLLTQINFQILAGTGNVGQRAKILLWILPLNIILNWVFIHYFWIYGSALAVWLSWIPLWYLSHRAIRTYAGKIEFSTLLYNVILAWICALISHYIITYSGIQSIWWIISIAVCTNLIIFSLGNFRLLSESVNIIGKNIKNS